MTLNVAKGRVSSESVQLLPIEKITLAQYALSKQIFHGRRHAYLNIGEIQMCFTPILLRKSCDQPISLRLSLGQRPVWLELSRSLVERCLQKNFEELSLELLPAFLQALLLESSAQPILEYFEQFLDSPLTVSGLEDDGFVAAFLAKKNNWPDQYVTLTLAIDLSGGGRSQATFILPLSIAEILAKVMADTGKPVWQPQESLAFTMHCVVGETLLSAAQFNRDLVPGAVILMDACRVSELQVGVVAGDVRYTAKIDGGDLTILQEGFELMSENSQVDEGNTKNLPVRLVFELGRTQLTLGELRALAPGYVMRLGKKLNAPVDVVANGVKVGRGQLVEVEGEVAVRLVQVDGQ